MHPLFKRSNNDDFAAEISLDDNSIATKFTTLEKTITYYFQQTGANLLFGGYGEKRSFYQSSSLFKNDQENRNIHLGMDYWLEAGSEVFLPVDAALIYAQDNAGYLNYGPTLIFKLRYPYYNAHYLLFGHLSRSSLSGLIEGQFYNAGTCIGHIGLPFENGNWPPHLHVQLINDLMGHKGDFPGLCEESAWFEMQTNCMKPNFPIF